MSNVLPDGTVVMSGFGVGNAAMSHGTARSQSMLGITVGEVVGIIYPEESKYGESECIYKVEVRQKEANGATGTLMWYCRLAVPFEGLADFSRPTIRPATYNSKGKLIADGSKVIVAAQNGDVAKAFIIGCVKQKKRKDRKRKNPQRANREYEAEFNGVHFFIEDDGSFSIEVPGATDQDGKPDKKRDTNNKGTNVRFDKTGDVTISDKNGESITVSPGRKTIDMLCETYHVKATKVATIDGARINVGTEGSSENLVLGQKLVEALKELAKILQTQNVSLQGNLGYPVPMSPEILMKVKAWEAKYLQGGPAPILAKNKFTER